MEQAFSSVICLEQYIKSDIHINVHVMENDGSLISVIINAVNVALLHAGIMLTDLCVSCTIGLVSKQLCLDCTQIEENSGSCYVPVAMKGRTKDVIYMQLSNKLNITQLSECLELVSVGCDLIKEVIDKEFKSFLLKEQQ